MEKIKIYTDDVALEQYTQNRTKLNEHITEFARQLAENNLNFNKEIFVRFLKEGTGYVWMLLRGQIERDIENAKITSEIAKSNLLVGIKQRADEFQAVHNKILTGLTLCEIQSKQITIVNGKSVTTPKEIEDKTEELSVYIESEDQNELYLLQEKLCKNINNLEAFLKERKLFSIFERGNPNNLEDYILFEKDPKIQITELQARLGGGVPPTGGMIASPNPDAIYPLRKGIKQ